MQTPQDEAHDRPAPQPWVVRSFVVQPLAFKQPDTASTAAAPEGEQKAPQAESVAPGAPLLVQLRGAILAIAQRQLDNPLVRQSAVPYLACYAPLIATSLFAPHWLTWMMGWISAVALYQVTQLLDETAFASSPPRCCMRCRCSCCCCCGPAP